MYGAEYIAGLTLSEKIVFLRMIIKLIGKDGRIDDKERMLMKELAQQYQIPKELGNMISQPVSEDDLIDDARSLLDRKKSLYLIKELLTVANKDEDLADTEIDFVIKISQVLKIENEKVGEINQLVLDQLVWQDKYKHVMEL
ncbi:MAG: hypothetical protein Q4D80_05630 [Pseudomonadota bacterium]|nr:hypothetical protein [Pseudomonadota bacterium]